MDDLPQQLRQVVQLINGIRSLPGIVDKPGLRESIALLQLHVTKGCDGLIETVLEQHLCFLAKRRLDLENLRKAIARLGLLLETRDDEIESWFHELEEAVR